MFRLWAKIWKDNHMLWDHVVCNADDDMTRTHKVFAAIEEVCGLYNLAKPIWLESAVTEFQKHARVRFGQDHFIEAIAFDYLELQVIEED